ncbi:MAG: TRAP transporter large permease subunit [Acidobacteriota bacterium]|nr:TRAP transporter large permease subunit [Acidobacteriota bacterium]
MVLLPLAEAIARKLFSSAIPGAGPFVQHLTLVVAFLGAALAAREGKMLALATGELLPKGVVGRLAKKLAGTVGALASVLLCRASLDLTLSEREFGSTLPLGVPVWLVQMVLPVAFLIIAVRLVGKSGDDWRARLPALGGFGLGLLLGQFPLWLEGFPTWLLVVVVVAATVAGMPIFAALGGAAVLLFLADGLPAAAVPAETYRLTVSSTLPAIPLFTLAGFLLAQGKAAHRLLDVFRALFGWIPGGTAVVTALLCAFFTVFTGGSGVTILALGGLLFTALQADRYREQFSLGLLTASGSLGLLFPPALPLILYGIVAAVPIRDLFIGGMVPGILLVGLIAAWGVREGIVRGSGREPFVARKALEAIWHAKWELLLPMVILVSIFGGFATLVESAALAALYALVTQRFVHRDIPSSKELRRVFTECVVLIGGVLIILGVAMGFTSYLVDAQVASSIVEWAQASISSKLVFLLALNVFLLLVGCLMDIFSAIVVVVPLIVPLGVAFGVDPIHLGIIFVANLELGYLTPPVGLNLFLAAYRFEKPLLEVWRSALVPLALLGVGVLLITYWPDLTLGLLEWVGRE